MFIHKIVKGNKRLLLSEPIGWLLSNITPNILRITRKWYNKFMSRWVA